MSRKVQFSDKKVLTSIIFRQFLHIFSYIWDTQIKIFVPNFNWNEQHRLIFDRRRFPLPMLSNFHKIFYAKSGKVNFKVLNDTHVKTKSSQQRCSMKKAVLKNFAIFTGKHLCWSLFLIKLLAFKVFSNECCENFKNKFFEKDVWTVPSGKQWFYYCFDKFGLEISSCPGSSFAYDFKKQI